MANMYNPPAVSSEINQFDSTQNSQGSPAGNILIWLGDTEFSFIIQSFSIEKGERTQEVRTLADTSHIYTFGKTLPRIRFSGMFINPVLSPAGDGSYNSKRGGISSARDLLNTWDSSMRAKTAGTTSAYPIEVDLLALNRTFFGVGVELTISNDVSLEAMIPASFTFISMREESL